MVAAVDGAIVHSCDWDTHITKARPFVEAGKSVLIDKDSAKIEANWYPYTREKYRLFTDLMVNLFGRSPLRLVRFALAGMKLERYSKRAAKDGGR